MGIYIDGVKMPKASNDDMIVVIRSKGSADVWQSGIKEYETKATELDLVRCGECVWHGENDTCIHREALIIARDDDFCSYGERSSDEE